MTSFLDLGHLRLNSTKSALSLHLSASVRLLSPHHDLSRDFVPNTSTLWPSNTAWVSAASGLCLLLDISLSEHIAHLVPKIEVQTHLINALRDTMVSQANPVRKTSSSVTHSLGALASAASQAVRGCHSPSLQDLARLHNRCAVASTLRRQRTEAFFAQARCGSTQS